MEGGIVRSSVIKLGENKGTPRIYLQGQWLLRAGFKPDEQIEVSSEPNKLTVRLGQGQGRKISSKLNGTIPVIDIQNEALRDVFQNAEKLQVIASR